MSIHGVTTTNNNIFNLEALNPQQSSTSVNPTAQSAFSSPQKEQNNATDSTANYVTPHNIIDQHRDINDYNFVFTEQNSTAFDENELSSMVNATASSKTSSNPNELPAFNISMLEKIKSGLSFQDALSEVKAERFSLYFEDALANNGGDVRSALETAKAKLSKDTQLSDEDLYGIVQNMAEDSSKEASQTNSPELQRIAKELGKYLEELENKIDIDAVPIFNKSHATDETEEMALKAQFVNDIASEDTIASQANIENTSQKLTEKERRERDAGIKQYEKVAKLS